MKFNVVFIILLGLISHIITAQDKIKGITMVAPPSEFHNNPLEKIGAVNANWTTLVPFAFMRQGDQKLVYDTPGQWWGERSEGVRKCVISAHAAGLKIMLKPQIYIPGSWIGDLDVEELGHWDTWESQYKAYIMTMVDIAVAEGVQMFCIGTEINHSAEKREHFWRAMIKDIRAVYDGQLTYSANWDSYDKVPFWDALDYIGISAYFPLTDTATPRFEELLSEWKPIVKKLSRYSKRRHKQILFTEFGYLSVDGCAFRAWELEKKVDQLSINEQAQANALESLFLAFWSEDFWAGGFLWKWFPNMKGHEGYIAKDYTPQNKEAQTVIERWYGRD